MLAKRGILASAHALLHPSVPTAADRDRHALFVAHMLMLSFAALGLAPFFLAFHGAPTPAESLLFALALAPAGAAMLVARSGRLDRGHLAASLALACLGLVVAFGLHAGPGAAVAWLAAAQCEAAASLDRRSARLGTAITGAALLAVVAACLEPSLAFQLPRIDAALLAAPALLCVASALWRLTGVLRALQAHDAAQSARGAAIEAALGHVVLDLDAGGQVRSAGAGTGGLGLPEQEIVGRGLFDRVHVADRPAFLKLVDDAAQSGSTLVETVRLRADGETPHFLTVEMRVRRVGAAGRDCVALLSDVGAREGREQEIGDARRALEAALRAKDHFLTTMSHELRTPLNSIIGFSEILASRTTRPDDSAKQIEFARVIRQSGQHLLGIVNAVLDMSRIQVGTYPIHPEPFDAAALLDRAVEAIASAAREGQVELVRDYPASLEEVVGDTRALKLALGALLSNAVKFTPARGRVTLAARPEGNALVISIADTGVGIAAGDLARIGDPFFQAGGGDIGRAFDGSGLGLALVRGLVGLHGGVLSIESEPGHGTCVTVRLPLDCRAIASRTAQAAIEIVPRHRSTRRPPSRMKDAA